VTRALIIRPSSLGDIVHALPIVHDIRRHRPDIAVDWVAEEAFAALLAMHRGVDRVIPVALRRWRHQVLDRATWREAAAFRLALIRDRYDLVLDLQEQVKGALLAWLARGPVHGPDRASIREPAASFSYRRRHRIDPAQHLIDRCRQLAAAAFGYPLDGPPHFDLIPPPLVAAPDTPYAIFVHASSRADKLWPEAHWRALIAHFTQAGLAVLLPWGTSEEASAAADLPMASWAPPLAHDASCRRSRRCSPAPKSFAASTPAWCIWQRRWARRRSRCSSPPIRRLPASRAPVRIAATWAGRASFPRRPK
jgi:heptosyltransferase-1